MGKLEFGSSTETVHVGEHTLEFRALTVREMESLVKQHEKQPEEHLTAAIIVAGNTDGKLEGYTYEDFADWPSHYFRRVQSAVAELNGLGSIAGGN